MFRFAIYELRFGISKFIFDLSMFRFGRYEFIFGLLIFESGKYECGFAKFKFTFALSKYESAKFNHFFRNSLILFKSCGASFMDLLCRLLRPTHFCSSIRGEKLLISYAVKIIFVIARHLVAEAVTYRFIKTASFLIQRRCIDVYSPRRFLTRIVFRNFDKF
jgi:hypothetical protein